MWEKAIQWRPRGRQVPGWLARVPSVPLGIALAVGLWLLIVAFSAQGHLFSTAQEAYCYWLPSLADPYRLSIWTDPVAYVYSPAFLQLIAPLKALDWTAFVAVWTALLLLAVGFLTGPRLLWVGVLVAAVEISGGNISLFLAVAIVVGFRWPAAWALVLLTKVTPGVGLLWFLVRREWRNLWLALGATVLVAAGSFVLSPSAWGQWLQVLVSNAGRGGTWAAVPVALWLRVPVAVVLVAWGARTDRRWTVPVAAMLALPALWYGSLSMLLALIPLAMRAEPRSTAQEAGPLHDGSAGRWLRLPRVGWARALVERRDGDAVWGR